MRIKARFFALYRELAGKSETSLEVEEGATVARVQQQLAQNFPKLKDHLRDALVAVNSRYAEPGVTVKDGDEIAWLPPLSGGSGECVITSLPIPTEQIISSVIQETDGCVVTFVGTVRSPSEGKIVVSLEYEAYKEMAEAKLREIKQEIAARWHLEDVAICHRVGKLKPGDISLVIAVASPHRPQAFEACRHAIERLKQIVPIWKKEVYGDGARWVEEK